MVVLSQIAYRSGTVVRRFGPEVVVSLAALAVVAFLVARICPSADPGRFDRSDPTWVGELGRPLPTPTYVSAPQTSASLTVPAVDADRAAGAANPAAKPAKAAAAARRVKPAEAVPEASAPAPASPAPVAASAPDLLDLSRVTSRLPSREALLQPFDAVGSTVVNFFRRP